LWMGPHDFVTVLKYYSVIFTTRRYMRKRDLCCRPMSVRPSVRLPVCYVGALYPNG